VIPPLDLEELEAEADMGHGAMSGDTRALIREVRRLRAQVAETAAVEPSEGECRFCKGMVARCDVHRRVSTPEPSEAEVELAETGGHLQNIHHAAGQAKGYLTEVQREVSALMTLRGGARADLFPNTSTPTAVEPPKETP
jgi:hypothetical protein